MQQSPFIRHRDKVMGYYSTAAWLRCVVLAMWGGKPRGWVERLRSAIGF